MNPILDFAIRATGLMLLGVVAWKLARGQSAEARCSILRAVFVGLAVLPLATAIAPRWEPVLPWVSRPEPIYIESQPLAAGEFARYSGPAEQSTPWGPILWLALAAFVAAPAAVGWVALRRTWARSSTLDESLYAELAAAIASLEVQRPIRARLGAVKIPLVFGCRDPHILLPRDFGDWPETHRRSALLHEAAHIRRFDCAWLALAAAVRAVYACHPLVWWLSGALKDETELAADERAIRSGVEATDYASALVAIARDLQKPGRLVHSQGVTFMNHRQLDRRVRGALTARRRGFTLFGALGLMATAMTTVFGIAAVHPITPEPEIFVVAQEEPTIVEFQATSDDLYSPAATTVAVAQATAKSGTKAKAKSIKSKQAATSKPAKPAKGKPSSSMPAVAPTPTPGDPVPKVYGAKPASQAKTPRAPAHGEPVTWVYTTAPLPTPGTATAWVYGRPAAPNAVSSPAPSGDPIYTTTPAPAVPNNTPRITTTPAAAPQSSEDVKQAKAILEKLLQNAKGKPEEEELKRVLELLSKTGGHSMGDLPLLSATLLARNRDLAMKELAQARGARSEMIQALTLDRAKIERGAVRASDAKTLLALPRMQADKAAIEAERNRSVGAILSLRPKIEAGGKLQVETELVKAYRAAASRNLAPDQTLLARVVQERNGVIEIEIIDEKGKKQTIKVRPDQVKKTIKLQRGKDGKIRVIDK